MATFTIHLSLEYMKNSCWFWWNQIAPWIPLNPETKPARMGELACWSLWPAGVSLGPKELTFLGSVLQFTARIQQGKNWANVFHLNRDSIPI